LGLSVIAAVVLLAVLLAKTNDATATATTAATPTTTNDNNNNNNDHSLDDKARPSPADVSTGASPAPSLTARPTPPTPPRFTALGTFHVLETVPHDATAFTQGLVMMDMSHNTSQKTTIYYEGTGLYGESQVRIVDLATGTVLRRHVMDRRFFGEGLCYYPDPVTGQGRLIQITWQEQTGFVYDATDLTVQENFTYATTNGQGWGISYAPVRKEFYVSDGTAFLHTWDAATRTETSKVAVTMQRQGMTSAAEIGRINALEWDPYTDTVYANVWMQDVILRIDPVTGFTRSIYDLQQLYPNRPSGTDVLNGIALTGTANEIWVTGKLWPNMYRIRLIEPTRRKR
jgi:glutaminyl-peptide cyclotransferase